MESEENINQLLDKASSGDSSSIKKFYAELLKSKVIYIPKVSSVKNTTPLFGQAHTEEYNFNLSQENQKSILAIFTKHDFAKQWVEDPNIFLKEIEFNKLIWLIGKDTWLHLNPSCDVGKEISPWEIELLKSGVDAIDEIANDLSSNEFVGLNIKNADELFPEFKKKLLPILEIYSELKEAFLVLTEDDDNDEKQILLGIKYDNISLDKRSYLRAEFINAGKNFLPINMELQILDDLENGSSHNQKFFQYQTPFYFSRNTSTNTKQKSVISNILSKLWK